MGIDLANAHELAQIAGEIGADVLSGDLRYPSETGGWPVISRTTHRPQFWLPDAFAAAIHSRCSRRRRRSLS